MQVPGLAARSMLCLGAGLADVAAAPSAADVAGAPVPGEESGRTDGAADDDGALRSVGRGILFVPRVAFEIAVSPVRAGVWAYERYELRDRWYAAFFNDARTVGLYPILGYDPGFGTDVGARFVARDLLGEREQLSVRLGSGGTYSVIAKAAVRSGRRLDPLELELVAEFERRPRDRFFGIGNEDETEPGTTSIDPLARDAAVATRYRQQLARAAIVADMPVVADLHVRTAGALTALSFGASESGTSIDDVFATERIVGFDGVRHAYGDVELVWDSRRRATRWEIAPIHSVGGLASLFAGRVAVEDGPDLWRIGLNAEHLLRVASGPRVISTRVHAEAVDARIEDVPFDELPKLGGRHLLRGYPTDRFRDRVAALGTIEYRWDLSKFLLANLFVDAGRVAPAIDELATGQLRIGYGFGIDAYTERSFVLRTTIETSIDGGMFFNIAFDPTFDLDLRVERR